MEEYIFKNNKKLRCGYTTGSCAAAAAQRATAILLGASLPQYEPINLVTPRGNTIKIPVSKIEVGKDWVVCGVKKDSGDDPDVTNGILVYAKVWKNTNARESEEEITIIGGVGVGRVTKAGLACNVGEPAINPVPLKMIKEQIKDLCQEFKEHSKISVEISIPEGVEIAKRTYNPRLGIIGGISVLGTSGIVEPMSQQALIDTIKVEMSMRKANGAKYLVITPGNYGETFIKENTKISEMHTVKCSNFIGEALDYGVSFSLNGLLLVGHIGKLIKVAGGKMNTHSQHGDHRMEIMGNHARYAGASKTVLERISHCITTDDALRILDEAGIREQTLDSILKSVDIHIKERTHQRIKVGAVIFSNQYGYLGQTIGAKEIIEQLAVKTTKTEKG